MSAYVQSNDHIDLLVTFARTWEVVAYHQSPDTNPIECQALDARVVEADDLGRELLGENVLSVQHHYGSMTNAERADYAASVLSYRWQPVSVFDVTTDGDDVEVAVLKAVHGYVYQSCEHPGWFASRSYAWAKAIEGAAMRRLPGYDEAGTWSFQRAASSAAA